MPKEFRVVRQQFWLSWGPGRWVLMVIAALLLVVACLIALFHDDGASLILLLLGVGLGVLIIAFAEELGKHLHEVRIDKLSVVFADKLSEQGDRTEAANLISRRLGLAQRAHGGEFPHHRRARIELAKAIAPEWTLRMDGDATNSGFDYVAIPTSGADDASNSVGVEIRSGAAVDLSRVALAVAKVARSRKDYLGLVIVMPDLNQDQATSLAKDILEATGVLTCVVVWDRGMTSFPAKELHNFLKDLMVRREAQLNAERGATARAEPDTMVVTRVTDEIQTNPSAPTPAPPSR